jgi:hypothetical protein
MRAMALVRLTECVASRDHLADGHSDRLRFGLMAILGRNQAGRTPEGRRRLDDPKDVVQIEIETALTRSIPVIPILVEKVTMPADSKRPPSLSALAYRKAIEVAHGRDFQLHVARLIEGIERL